MILAAVTLATDSHGENKIYTHQHQMKQEPRETEEKNQGKKQNDRLEKPQDREIVDHVQQFNLNRKLDDLGARCNSCTELNTEILQILKEKLRKT
mmetsp:Transcript_34666/g.55457  ORF Transcript_34666/g.55457 Transcript_34666/m.55457 type:complete len:95 (-) Transcript_34666:115-399(-)